MRSYYTYGAIPDPVRTVRGFDDGGLASAPRPGLAGAGGEDKPLMQQLYERGEISEAEYRAWLAEQSAGPSKKYNPVTRLPTTMAQPGALTGLTMKDIFVGGVPAGIDPNAAYAPSTESAQWLSEYDRLARARQLEPGALSGANFGGLGEGFGSAGGSLIPVGNFSMLQKNEPAASQVMADYAKLMGWNLPEAAKYFGTTEADLLKQADIAEYDPNTRRGALNDIKDKASTGDFQGAFEAAKAAENRLGGDFVSNLVSPDKLRYLAPEMSTEDVNKYYDALKNVVGEKEYEQRYVSTGNEFNLEDARAKSLAAAEQGAAFVNPQSGVKAEEDWLSKLPIKQLALLTAAAMGATAIPGLLGGASGASGAGAGAAGAGTAGAGAAGAGAAGAAAGAAGAAGAASVLPEVVVAATKLGLTIPQYLALAGGTGALASTVGGGAGGAGAATTPTAPTEPTGGLDQLEEVVVKAKPPVTPPIIPPVVVPPTGGLTTPPTEPAPPEDTLEEVEVKAKKPPTVVPPPVITPPLSPPTEPPPTDADLEEVEVKAKKPPQPDIPPPVIVPPPSPPPPEPPPADGGLEEVEVKAKRPPPVIPPPVIITPPLTPPPAPKDILKDYKPVEIKEPSSPLEDFLKDPKNILKILGALGSATSGGGGTTGGVGASTGTGAFGGALPKYTYERQQLAPPIDYYTYGTRPEAKFFEGSYKLAEPTQPAVVVPPPSEPSGVVTSAAGGYIDDHMTGGLIGYAEGGKPERYVDGPGSGRDDKIPALLSDGEYVIDAETLALLGDGSSKEGARRMDQFRAKIRQHKGRALSRGRISPNAKSPEKYMGGGLS